MIAAIGRGFSAVHWYLAELMGQNAYRNYCASYIRKHGDLTGAMGEREFWRDVTDAQDRNPGTRCC